MNKTSISSVVCLDIIDFSKKSKTEQKKINKQLHALIDHAVVDISEKDHMVVDTEHGAIITCSGALESALEDALFIALTIRDEVLNANTGSEAPLYLLLGINLGSVRLDPNVKVNEAPKVIGEGLTEAQRIMSFANPNQILVSRAYYDMASKLTLEVAQMFEKYDMHAYEHDIYAVRRLNEKAAVENAAAALDHIETPEEVPVKSTLNWSSYALPALLALIMFFVLVKWMQHDESGVRDQIKADSPVSEQGASDMTIDTIPDPLPEIVFESETKEDTAQEQVTQGKPTKKKAKAVVKKASVVATEKKDTRAIVGDRAVEETRAETPKDDDKSTWDTFKDSVKSGADPVCSQAEKALNQCQ